MPERARVAVVVDVPIEGPDAAERVEVACRDAMNGECFASELSRRTLQQLPEDDREKMRALGYDEETIDAAMDALQFEEVSA